MWFMLNTCLLSCSLGFGALDKGCLHDQVASPWPWALNLSYMLLHFCCCEKKVPWVISWGRESIRKPVHEFLKTICAFFPYQPTVYPDYITVINLSHRYDSMPTSMSPTESSNIGVTLGTPNGTMKRLPNPGFHVIPLETGIHSLVGFTLPLLKLVID